MTTTTKPRRSAAAGSERTAVALVASCLYTVAAVAVLLTVDGLPTAALIPIALPVLLLTPGYAVVTALIPPSDRVGSDPNVEADAAEFSGDDRFDSGLSPLERAALAVVTSLAVVPGIAFAVELAIEIDVTATLAAIAGVTVIATVVALLRIPAAGVLTRPTRTASIVRRSLGERRVVPVRDSLTVVAVVLVVGLLAASAVVSLSGDAASSPETEFYLSEDADAPDAVGDDEEVEYPLRIGQHGSEPQQYTIVVTAGDPGSADDGSGTWREVDRTSAEVGPDAVANETYRLPDEDVDEAAAVRFLLYTDDAPSSPDVENAHRALQFRLNETGE